MSRGLGDVYKRQVERTPLPPEPKQTLIYFDDQQWQLAEQKLAEVPNATLCLAETKQAAKQLADSNDSDLIDLTESR